MRYLSIVIFYLLLALLLVTEGWALIYGREISYHLILFTPLIIFTLHGWGEKTIRIPGKMALVSLVFILLVFGSTFFAVNKQLAFEYRFFYVSVFLIGLYVYNHRELSHYFPHFIILSTSATLVFTFIVRSLLHNSWTLLFPHSYQFIITQGLQVGHDLLGAFVLMPLAFFSAQMLFKPTKQKGFITASLVLLLLLTYLRAAYVGFLGANAVLICGNWKTVRNKLPRLSILVFGVTIVCLLVITFTNIRVPFIGSPNTLPINGKFIPEKIKSIQTRITYLAQSANSVRENPLFGIGSNNYRYASYKFSKIPGVTHDTSHNLFLDIAVENGLPAFFIFIAFLALSISKNLKAQRSGNLTQKGLFGVFIAFFILFQFSHYHRSYFLFTLFLVTAALLYDESQNIMLKTKWLILISLLPAFISVGIIASKIAIRSSNPVQALSFYPLSSEGYRRASIKAYNIRNFLAASRYLELYAWLYGKDPDALEFIGDTYTLMGENGKAYHFYTMELTESPLEISALKKRYVSAEKAIGGEAAKSELVQYIDRNNILKNNGNDADIDYLREWCAQEHIECIDN